MTMREHLENILALAKAVVPDHICEQRCLACEDDSRLINAIHAALSACDNGGCEWRIPDGHRGIVKPGCEPPDRLYSDAHGFKFCPHCGRKIVQPLPLPPKED